MRKWVLPSLAMMGACIGIAVIFWTQRQLPIPPILFPPATSPYAHWIAAAGTIEASSENISVGSPFSEIVTKIYVKEGDWVSTGDLLFELDPRFFEAQELTAAADLRSALIEMENQKTQFSFYKRVKDRRAISQQDYDTARFALLTAKEQVKVAKGKLREIQTNLARSKIHSPVDGQVLQVNVHVGEIAPVVPFVSQQATLILLGTVQPLQVRVNIDEEEAWRFQKGARATAFVRGNSQIHFPLKFLRIEPYMVSKSTLTGDTREKTDTRVLQVLYTFDRKSLPLYVGQVLDIYLEVVP